jgi:Holliday junction resolvasome RuvABC endonuclease subunit
MKDNLKIEGVEVVESTEKRIDIDQYILVRETEIAFLEDRIQTLQQELKSVSDKML